MITPGWKIGLKFAWRITTTRSTRQKCSKSRVLEPPWRILFFGNDHFALESLKPLNSKLNTATLVSSLEVVTGQRTPVRKFSESENLPIVEWPINVGTIREKKFDIGMVVSFGHLIPKDVIDAFPLGCINVHSSLLPKYRGAAPIIHAVMNGDSETGVSVMKIKPHRFDVGEILRQYRIPISPDETSVELESRLAAVGGQMIMECLRDLPRCLRLTVAQPADGISYAPKVKSSQARVDWTAQSAVQIYNLHRALGHVHPLRTTWRGAVVKLTELVVDRSPSSAAANAGSGCSGDEESHLRRSALDFLNDAPRPQKLADNRTTAGRVEFAKNDKMLFVTCGAGGRVAIRRLSVGGKLISALDFFNGYLTKVDEAQWAFGT